MRGKFLIAQIVLSFLGILFYVIAYGGGIWWRMETSNPKYDVTLSLWEICGEYGNSNACASLPGSDYMQSGEFQLN